MAFNVTDEGLDALDRMDEPSRKQFLGTLAPEELTQLHAAIPAWKSKRSVVPRVGLPNQVNQNQTSPPTNLTAESGISSPMETPSPGKSAIEKFGYYANIPGRIADAFGYLGNKATDLAEYGWQKTDEVNQKLGMPTTPAHDLLRRSFASSILGEEHAYRNMPEEQRLKGINQLEDVVGPTGTTAALVGSQALGNLAGALVPASKTGKAVKGAQTLATAAKAVGKGLLTGAGTGYALGAFQGQDPVDGAIAGALLGGGIAGVVEGAQAAAPAIKELVGKGFKLGRVETENILAAMDEKLAPEIGVIRAETALEEGKAQFKEAKISDKDFKPSAFVIKQTSPGEYTAKILDYRMGGDSKVAEINVSTPEGRKTFRDYIVKHDVNGQAGEALNMPEEAYFELLPPITRKALPGETITLADGRKVTVKESDFEATTPGKPTAKVRPPDMDAPAAEEISPTSSVMQVGEDGHVKLGVTYNEPPTATLPPESIKPSKPIRGYIKDPNTNSPIVVDKVGNSHAVLGNVVVEDGLGNKYTVHELDFHPAKTLEQAEQELRNVGAVPVRVPVEPLKPGTIPQSNINNDLMTDEVMQSVVRRNKSLGEKLFGNTGLVSKHHLGARDMADMLREIQSVQDLGALRNDHIEALAKKLGGISKLETEVDRALGPVFEGKTTFESFAAKHPEIAVEVQQHVQGLMAKALENENELIRLGAIPESVRLNRAELESYLARQYYSYLLPKGKWARIVPDEAVREATEYIVGKLKDSGHKWTSSQVRATLQDIIGSQDPVASWGASDFARTSAFDRLKTRENLPAPIRKVLGEVQSGTVRMAQTLAQQEQLLARFKLLNEISANPAYYSHGPQPHLYDQPVPNNPKVFGPLAGGYVAPELYETLVQVPKIQSLAPNFWSKILSFRKGNQVASVRAHIRSLIGNWQSSIFANGLDVFKPQKGGNYLRKAARAIADYHGDPTGRTGAGKEVLMWKRLGADWAGASETEIGSDTKWVKELMSNIAKETGKDAYDISEKIIQASAGRYKSAVAKNGHLLDAQDRLFRIANAMAARDRALANPGKYLPGVPPEKLEQEAWKWAARRVNDSFMNASHVGSKVAAMRRNPVGAFAPFLTSRTEDARIYGLLASRMKEDPELKWRLMGWAMFGSGIYAANRYGLMGGGTKAAIDSASGNLTDKQKAIRQGPMALPIPGWSDKDPVRLFDPSGYFLPGELLQGHPDDAMFARVLANTALLPVSGGSNEAPERKLLESTGLIKSVNYDKKLMEGEAGIYGLAQELMRGGAVPAQVSQIIDVANKTQNNGKFGTPWNAGDAAAKLGFSGYIGPQSPTNPSGILEGKGNVSNLQKEIKFIAGRKDLTPERKQELIRAALEAMSRESTKIQERGNLMDKYIQSLNGGRK